MTEAEQSGPAPETVAPLLPERARARVVAWASSALGRMRPEDVPSSLARVAAFAPARRARLAGGQITGVLAVDEQFRARVAEDVREQIPQLFAHLESQVESWEGRVEAGVDVCAADDLTDLAAIAYLVRPVGWQDLLAAASPRADDSRASPPGAAARQLDHLRRQLESATASLKEVRSRHRDQLSTLKAENTDLRRKLGDARSRARSAEAAATQAEEVAEEVRAAASMTASRQDAELRRLRTRVEELERDLAGVRRSERAVRGSEALRARLLLDTLLDTAQGLRRELALPAVEGSPADAVEAHVAEQGSRVGSGHGSLTSDDPAMLQELLALPRVHLIVDGYNVTKTAWPALSLEQQRERLLRALAPLVARSGAEVTVVFDAADTTERPVVNRPRGVRVLYSRVGVIADDVIRELVVAEPRGRPLVVVSTDNQVVEDVVRAGARAVRAAALVRLIAPG